MKPLHFFDKNFLFRVRSVVEAPLYVNDEFGHKIVGCGTDDHGRMEEMRPGFATSMFCDRLENAIFEGTGHKMVTKKEKGLTVIWLTPRFQMVGQGRIELPTLGFSVRCSTD
jgi:hypothetical protein